MLTNLFIVCSLALIASVAYAMSAPANKWLGVGSGSRAGGRVINSILDSRYNCNKRASRALELLMAGIDVRRLAHAVALGTLHWSLYRISVTNFCLFYSITESCRLQVSLSLRDSSLLEHQPQERERSVRSSSRSWESFI